MSPIFNSGAVRAGGGMGSASSGGPSSVRSMREQWIDQQMSTPAIGSNVISQFLVEPNATTQGIDITFEVTDATGINSLSLVRAAVMDIQQGIVLQTWTASASKFAWSDTDKMLQAIGQAFYWLRLQPRNTNGTEQVVGPQFILLNPSLLPPLPLTAISASHAAAVNGTVLVTVNLSAIPQGDSVKIYISGYEGNPGAVAITQKSSAPLQFYLQQTGETVTIKAIATSQGGAEAASGPTCTLTLNGTATVPAKVEHVSVTQISSGNQVSWPSSLEAGVTQYQLYRGQRGSLFSDASILATIAATSAGTVLYLDTGGLNGDWQYFVVVNAASGNSSPSDAADPQILYSSSQLPPNTPANQISSGLIDSLDAGTNATVRIYGPGGVGTSWTKYFGYGPATRPAGSISGLAYTTQYYIMFIIASQTYVASTTYSDSLPDGYEWVGTIFTAPSAGGGGSSTATAAAAYNPSNGQLVSVYSTNNGYGYGSASVGLSPANGASVAANCQFGRVVSYTILNPGSGFVANPTVTVTKTSDYTGGGTPTTGNTAGGSRYVLSS